MSLLLKIYTLTLRDFRTGRVTHMIRQVGGGSREVVEVRFTDLSFFYDQVDGHFAFQTADVTVAEVIAELMNLRNPVFY